jgi:hypothetical protein
MARADAPDGGYVLAYRRVLDHPVFRDHGEALSFIYLIMLAAWRSRRVRYKEKQIDLERGQLAISVRDLATALNRSPAWANRFLKRLADRNMIETVSETGVNVITVCNYNEYQTIVAFPETPAERQPKQDRNTTETQNKERNKGNEGMKEKYIGDLLDPIPAKPNGTAKRKPTLCPWEDTVPDEQVQWAMTKKQWRKSDAVEQGTLFIDFKKANGITHTDWPAAWRYWCGNNYQKTKAKSTGIGGPG